MVTSQFSLVIWGLSWAAVATSFPISRDDTGLLTIGDLFNAGSDMCGVLHAVNDSLNAPAAHLFGIHSSVMSMQLPILHPSILLDPFGVIRFSFRLFSTIATIVNPDGLDKFSSADEVMTNLSQALAAGINEIDGEELSFINHINQSASDRHQSLNFTDSNDSRSDLQFDDNTSHLNASLLLTISDMMHLGSVTCSKLEKWKRRLNASSLNQILQIENLHLPVIDVQHPLDPIKLVDPLGLIKVPSKVISGAMGLFKDLFVG